MKTAEITLYEIFGYFLPGCVALVALYLIAWRTVLPASQDWSAISALGWAVVAGLAYITGHFLQALSNVLYYIIWKNPEQLILDDVAIVPSEILGVAHEAARRVIGLSENDDLNTKTLYGIMDNYIQQHGKTESRDIYIYREGFYRGLSAGFLMLAVGSSVHMTGEQTIATAFGTSMTLTKPCMAFITGLSVIIAILTGFRYKRFATYRVKNCLFSFLAILNTSEKGGFLC